MDANQAAAWELLREAIRIEAAKGYVSRLGDEQPSVPEVIAVECIARALSQRTDNTTGGECKHKWVQDDEHPNWVCCQACSVSRKKVRAEQEVAS